MLGLVASVLLLLTAGGMIVVISRHPATFSAGRGSTPGIPGAAAIGAEASVRRLASSWVAQEVSRDAIVSCDPLMCLALEARGIPVGDLLVLRPGTSDPLGSEVVIETAALRSLFRNRLSSVYAPTVLASFGLGSAAIVVRAIAPDGARAYEMALIKDLQARKAVGALLLHNRRITLTASAARQLAAGQVDSRLLSTLAPMATAHPIVVMGFGDSGPGAGPGVPLRSVDLGATRGAPWTGNSAYVQSVLAFLRAQLPPYRPASVETVLLTTRQTVLRIEFAAPSPLGLLNRSGP